MPTPAPIPPASQVLPCKSCGDLIPHAEVLGRIALCQPCRDIAQDIFQTVPDTTTAGQIQHMVRERREAQRAAVGQFTPEQLDRLALALFRGGFDLPHGDPSGDYVGTENRDALSAALVAADFTLDTPASDHAWPLAEAIRLTVEYLGTDMLPARPGWSWFDALNRYDPPLAWRFVNQPVPMGNPLPHLSDEQTELLGAALTALHEVCLRQAVNNETAAASTYRPPQMGPVVHDDGLLRTAAQCRQRAAAAAELAELLGVGIEGDGPDEDPT